MKKYTSEVKQNALAMMKTMGAKYTSNTLKIADCTLHRWRREAEIEALIAPITSCANENEERLMTTASVSEKPITCEETTLEQSDSHEDTSALDEAVQTIELLTRENAHLLKIIKQLRSVIKEMADAL